GLGAWFDILADAKNNSSGYKLVLTTHGGFFHTGKRGLLKWVYRTFLLPARWGKADWIFFVSANDQANFEGLDFSRSSVLGNGVDVAPLLKLSLAKKDPHQFIFVGRLSRNKRVDRLLEVFSHLVKRDSHFQLHIVGPDWEGIMNELREQTKQLGIGKNIVFHGTLSSEKVKKVYEKSLFFISASEYEGFGITAIEGMAAGSIPILQTIPTFRDFAGENRGLIVDFAQPEAAAESILTFTQSMKSFSPIQRKCRDFSNQFEWERILKTMMTRLEGL
ncbi:MAG: glycosyltransferase family 4 protein, partial [archaeon]